MYLFGPLSATPFWSIIGAVMKQTDPQYKLRLSQELKDQVEAAAKEAGRSMNAEIVARLEGSFAGAGAESGGRRGSNHVVDDLKRMAARIEQGGIVSGLRMQYEASRMRLDALLSRLYELQKAVDRERSPQVIAEMNTEIDELRYEVSKARKESDEIMKTLQYENTRLLSLADRDFNTHKSKPTDPL